MSQRLKSGFFRCVCVPRKPTTRACQASPSLVQFHDWSNTISPVLAIAPSVRASYLFIFSSPLMTGIYFTRLCSSNVLVRNSRPATSETLLLSLRLPTASTGSCLNTLGSKAGIFLHRSLDYCYALVIPN